MNVELTTLEGAIHSVSRYAKLKDATYNADPQKISSWAKPGPGGSGDKLVAVHKAATCTHEFRRLWRAF